MKKLNIKVDLDAKKLKEKMGIKDGIDGKDGKDAFIDTESIALEASKLVRGIVTVVSSFNNAPKNAKIGDILIVEDTGETYIYE